MQLEVFTIFFIAAMMGGIVSTSPPGPLNIRLLIFFLKKEKTNLLAFQTGIILADIACSFFTILIAQKTLETNFIFSIDKKYIIIIQSIFIIMIIIMGIRYIISAKSDLSEKNEKLNSFESEKKTHGKLMRHFLEGVVGTLTIPSLIPFWYLWWMGQNFTYKLPVYLIAISVALGVYFGDLFIFKIYRFFAAQVHERILRISIRQIEFWVGYLLLLFASILFIKIFLS